MSISRAETDLAQAKMEIQRLECELAVAQERAIKIQHYLELAKLYGLGATVSTSADRRRRRQPTGKYATYRKAAVETIRRAGHPMKTRSLVHALSDQGIKIEGKDPVIILSGVLSRSTELEMRDRSVGWAFKEWPKSGLRSPGADDQNSNDGGDDSTSEPSEIVSGQPNGPEA